MSLLAAKASSFIVPRSINIRSIYGRCRTGNRDLVGFGINGGANYKDDPHFPFPSVRFKENTRDICALREKEKGDWKQLCCEEKKALYRASFCQTFAEFQHPTGYWKFIMGSVLIVVSFGFWSMIYFHYYMETMELWGPEAKLFLKDIIMRLIEATGDPTGSYFGQRISLLGLLDSNSALKPCQYSGHVASMWCIGGFFLLSEPLPASLSKASQKQQLRRMLELRVNPIDGLSSKWDYDNDRWK